MADDVDIAAGLQAEMNARAANRRKPVPDIAPEGWCHACGEGVPANSLFCNAECTEEFERLERQRGMM